jgi:hypothetical protein
MLRPWRHQYYFYVAAMPVVACLMQLLQQFVHLLQDIGGQRLAKSAQGVWDFFMMVHIHISVFCSSL